MEMLKTVYYAYFYSIISYGIIFWGNSTPSIKIFRPQKRVLWDTEKETLAKNYL